MHKSSSLGDWRRLFRGHPRSQRGQESHRSRTAGENSKSSPTDQPDRELLDILRRDPAAGWPAFLDRYSAQMLGWLHDLGFQGDDAMDSFVYVCEKLAANECRRLRQIKRLGDRGEIVPWLRQVVRNQAVSWTWTRTGRPRLPRPIDALGDLDQQVFRLHFWEGHRSAEVHARLLMCGLQVSLIEVYTALETVYRVLGDGRRWRLASALERRRAPLSLDQPVGANSNDPAHTPLSEPRAEAEDPEAAALATEQVELLETVLSRLSAEDRLMVRLRFEDDLTHLEIGKVLDTDARAVGRRLSRSLEYLRQQLESQTDTSLAGDKPTPTPKRPLHHTPSLARNR